MKIYKKISNIILILIAITLILISFIGIYKQKEYKIINVVNKYLLGMEFEGIQEVKFIVDDSILSETIYDKDGNIIEQEEGKKYSEENGYTIKTEKVNKKENLTKGNYILSKKILEKRVNGLLKNEEYKEYKQYDINQMKNGNIILKIPNKSDYNYVIENIIKKGEMELIDATTKEVLMDNSYIKTVSVVYGQENENKTKIYLQIQFNAKGTQELEEISKIYIQSEEIKVEKENEEEIEPIDNIKKVSINFDNTAYMTTYFGETIKTGTLNIPIGEDSDPEKINEYVKEANGMAILINTGVMPITYEIKINSTEPIITKDIINICLYSLIIIYIIYFAYNIIKFKLKGLIIGILQLGYIALFLLVLRYVNVVITLEGIIGIIISILISMLFANILLNNKNQANYINVLLNFTFKIIPLSIMAIIFIFGKTLNISSLGKVMFWGIVLCYIYNITFIKTAIENLRKEK